LTEKQEPHIHQQGKIGDDTGTTVFTVWNNAVESGDEQRLTFNEGQSYLLEGVVGNVYQGDTGVEVRDDTGVIETDQSFSPPKYDTHLTGALIDIQGGSGLIQRCSDEDCTRVLNSQGQCKDHGNVDGQETLRLKAVLDDGEQNYTVVILDELTAEMTGIDLNEALSIMEEELNKEAVLDQMMARVLGRHYEIRGYEYTNNIVAKEVEPVTKEWTAEAKEILESIPHDVGVAQ